MAEWRALLVGGPHTGKTAVVNSPEHRVYLPYSDDGGRTYSQAEYRPEVVTAHQRYASGTVSRHYRVWMWSGLARTEEVARMVLPMIADRVAPEWIEDTRPRLVDYG